MDLFIRNRDPRDIFATVIDLNTLHQDKVLDDVRINSQDTLQIDVQANGAGFGNIHWIAVAADDPAQTDEDDAKPTWGDTVDVST